MFIYKQSIQWHITEKCRNRCSHCYIDANKQIPEASIDEFLKILSKIQQYEEKYHAEVCHYSITGGDPFCHPDFEKLLCELSKRNKVISILGVPERITSSTIKMLEEYNVDTYQVSLDGLEKTHDDIRGTGSFTRTIEALKLLGDSTINAQVMFTLHNKNAEELFDLIDYLDRTNIAIFFAFDFLIFEGTARGKYYCFSPEEVDVLMRKYRQKKQQLNKQGSHLKLKEKPKLFETYNIINASQKFMPYSHLGGCSCGFDSLAVLPNGDVYPCRRLPIKVGNLLESSFEDVFINHIFMRRLRRNSLHAECCECDYAKICRGCPALSYSLFGDSLSVMPYCSQKVTITHNYQIEEPGIDCSTEEEYEYITRTLERKIQEEGTMKHLEGIKYDLRMRIRSHE